MQVEKKWVMALAVVTLLGVSQARAQWPDACGKDAVQYKVRTAKKQPMPGPPAGGMAQVIFIETLSSGLPSAPIARFATDGTWLGADRGPSYFAVSLPAGAHHLCASRQGSSRADKANFGTAELQLQAGQTYFFEFHIQRNEIGDASMQGGASLPGQYPGSMTAKDHPTVDTVAFRQLSTSAGQELLSRLALSSATEK